MALIVLDLPFFPAEATPLPLASQSEDVSDQTFTLYAFRRDGPDQPALPSICSPRVAPPGLLGLDCPVVSGNSGAPLLQHDGSEWQIAAVMVAASQSGPVRSWAVLPPLILLQRIGVVAPGR